MSSLLVEEIQAVRKFFKLPKEERELVFYGERGGYWVAFEGIIQELLKQYARPFCYVTSDAKDPVLQSRSPQIQAFYINHLLPFFLRLVDAKVFATTTPDLGKWYFGHSRHSAHYVYLFHSLISAHAGYNFGAFDNYDSMLCVGPYQLKELRRQEELYDLRQKRLVEAGYWRLERIMEAWRQQKAHTGGERKTVLIAPSWGEKNVLESCGIELISTLLNSGYKVIARPHTETIKRFPGLAREIEQSFKEEPNFILERSNASDSSILDSDVLISDASGITLEYAFGTERPVLFLDVPPKIRNPRYQELGMEPLELSLREKIGRLVSVSQIAQLPNILQEMNRNKAQFVKSILDLRQQNVYTIGSSSKVGADYIMSLLR